METFNYDSIIQIPVHKIELYKWLINISEDDYKRFSKGHIAIGLCTKNGAEAMTNVESIGGNLLVQHYIITEKEKKRVSLFSEKSDAYLFHILKVHIEVNWKMNVAYNDEHTSVFTCEINVKYPNKLLALAAKSTGTNYFGSIWNTVGNQI